MGEFAQSIRKRTLDRLCVGILCARCRRPMVVRFNRATDEPFLGCSGFPDCRRTTAMPVAVLEEERACLAVY